MVRHLSTPAVALTFAALALAAQPWLLGLATADGHISSPLLRLASWGLSALMAAAAATAWSRRWRPDPRPAMALALGFGIALGISEGLLALLSFQPKYEVFSSASRAVPWWSCPEQYQPCRFVRANMTDGHLYNKRGFRDQDEFEPVVGDDRRFRVLVLGDSFTWGAAAEPLTASWVDLVERQLGATSLVWNAGLPGTGQSDQVALAAELLPRLRPHVVILGFYMNDFVDNLYPPGRHLVFEDGTWADRYEGPGESPPVLGPTETWRRAHPLAPRGLPEIFLATRVGTALARGFAREHRTDMQPDHAARTVARLATLRTLVEAASAELIVVLIPSREDTSGALSVAYRSAKSLLVDLGIKIVEPLPVLSEHHYDTLHPLNSHWNNEGHRLAAGAVAASLHPKRSEFGSLPR